MSDMTREVDHYLDKLQDKRLITSVETLDSEDGVTELKLVFEDGYTLEIVPRGFGLNILMEQHYVGPAR